MKKLLPVAVAAALAGVNSAQAVHVNPDGQGEVLLYPFYTVEGGQDTYINVVNTTNEVKALKVRILESVNSQEVLDFNLYLSPYDHWSAVITRDPAGDGAAIATADTSCTVPSSLAATSPGVLGPFIPFRDFEYVSDVLFNTIERTKEGYVEIIEMGVVTGGTPGSGLAWAATHTPAKVPNNCGLLTAAWQAGGAWDSSLSNNMSAPEGGLYGYGVLIDVPEGTNATYDAVALDDFADGNILNTDPGNLSPSLGSSTDVYNLFDSAQPGSVISGTADNGLDAVSAVFMVSSIDNDYVLEPAVDGATDWVITFPTKRDYVQGVSPIPPFTDVWEGDNPAAPSLACEPIGITYWDREEQQEQPSGLDFSPAPPGPADFALCSEANVLTFNSSNVLEASERTGYDLSVIFDNGWANIDLTNSGVAGLSSPDRELLDFGNVNIFEGLPAIGFAVQKYVNGNLNGVLSNYAGSVTHKGERSIGSFSP